MLSGFLCPSQDTFNLRVLLVDLEPVEHSPSGSNRLVGKWWSALSGPEKFSLPPFLGEFDP